MRTTTLQKYDCDRCGFTYKKTQLKRQRGMLLCEGCRDNLKKIKQPNPRWMSPRDNSLSVNPVNSPTVYTISAATGIDALRQSREYSREGGRRHFFMHIVSDGGAVDISASPQIVAGLQGDVLTLYGTSDTNTIQLDDAAGVHLINDYSMVLKDGDSITLVYNASGSMTGSGWGTGLWGSTGFGFGSSDDGWVECSRNKGGI